GTSTLIATTDATNTDAAQRVFVMTLNPDGSVQANDLYSITILRPIDNLVDVPFGSFTSHVASGHTAIVNNIGGSTIDVRFSGFEDSSGGGSTAVDPQVSQAGVGVGGGQDFNFTDNPGTQNDITDRMRIDFFKDNKSNDIIDYGGRVTVNRFTFVMNQNNSPSDDGDALVRVYNQLGQEVQITGIVVNGQVLVGPNAVTVNSNDPAPGGPVTAIANGLGYELHGLGGGSGGQVNDNDTVQIITASGYSRIDISGIGNDAPKDTFDILLQSVAVPTPLNITFQTPA